MFDRAESEVWSYIHVEQLFLAFDIHAVFGPYKPRGSQRPVKCSTHKIWLMGCFNAAIMRPAWKRNVLHLLFRLRDDHLQDARPML